MSMSYDEAAAAVTAPGERFEMEEIAVFGNPTRVFKNAPPSLRTIFDTARSRGDATFLVYEDERWSFDDVMAAVDGLAAALVERYGVTKGDRVSIGMRNYPEWVISFAAITSIGAVSVSLNAWWTEDELDYALEDSGTKVLIADVERVERSRASAVRLGFSTIGVRLPSGSAFDADRALGGRRRRRRPDARRRHRSRRRRHHPLHLGHDRPSQGRRVHPPRHHPGAHRLRLPHRHRPDARARRRPGPTGAPAFILIVPLFHVTGCVPVMLSCFSAGIKLVIMYKWDPERALELIEREQVTNFVGVPTQSWDLLESPSFKERDTSSLVSVGGGGAPAPPQLVARRRLVVQEGPSVARLRHDRDQRLRPRQQRRRLRGPSHLDRPGRPRHADRGARPRPAGASRRARPARSGSRGRRSSGATGTSPRRPPRRSSTAGSAPATSDGSTTRASSTSRTGPRTWSCAPARTSTAPRSRRPSTSTRRSTRRRCSACPTSASAKRWRRRSTSVPGMTLSVEDLQAHVKERLAPFKVPSRVAIVDEALPRNPAGKILKRELRDAFTDA